MKILLSVLSFFILFSVNAQENKVIKFIDSVAFSIDNNKMLQLDSNTINNDKPDLGLKMKVVLSLYYSDTILAKYTNHVNATSTENGRNVDIITTTSFYFHHNQLAKVSEIMINEKGEQKADWYYANGKPIYYTFQSERSADRAIKLLTMSKGILQQFRLSLRNKSSK
jgi:hypothetical protein